MFHRLAAIPFRRLSAALALTGVLAASAAGCSARSAAPVSTAVADAQLAVRVKTALVNDVALGVLPIDVEARSGVVTLRGAVPSDAEIDRALALARGVPGVARVESALAVGESEADPLAAGDPSSPAGTPPAVSAGSPRPRQRLPALAPRPEGGPLRLIGLGASARLTRPSDATLGQAVAVGPLMRLRPRNGLGPTVAFNWTNVEIGTGAGGRPALAAVQLRPVMAGVEFGALRGRFWAGASVVAGYSFNRLDIDRTRAGAGRAIDVGNSFVWRPGVAVWADVTPRVGINVFGGYLFTRPEVTFASDAAIATERMRASSVVVSVGAAYWIF